jgi:diguanylate cyclase (GGDEF)-like protein
MNDDLRDLSGRSGRTNATKRRSASLTWVSRLMGAVIFAALAVWSQLAPGETSSQTRIIGLALVLLVAAYTILVAMQAGRSQVKLERSYSEHLERLSERLRHLAYHDGLTGLYNHRYFQDHLNSEFERAKRYGHPLSVAMLDVNHFKEVNDRYGHLTGDKLLSFLGQVIAENVRSSDIAARYGGDEFAVILPETEGEAARTVAAKIRDAVVSRRDWGGGLLGNVELDIAAGVATFPVDARTPDQLLHEADAALYSAKEHRSIPRATLLQHPTEQRRGLSSRG